MGRRAPDNVDAVPAGNGDARQTTDDAEQYGGFVTAVNRLGLDDAEQDRAFLEAIDRILPVRLGRRRGRKPSTASRN